MKNVHRKPMTERITWIEKGTLPKPKKKASAPKVKDAAAKDTAYPEKKADAQTTGNDVKPVTKKSGMKAAQKKS